MWALLRLVVLSPLALCPGDVAEYVKSVLPCTARSSIGSRAAARGLYEVADLLEDAVALIHEGTSVSNGSQPPHLSESLSSAIVALSRAAALSEASECPSLAAIVRNNLGLARYLVGQSVEAVADFRVALKFDPLDDIATRNRAWALQAVPHDQNHDGNASFVLLLRML